MASEKQVLQYLRQSYLENGARGGFWNLYGSAVSHRLLLEGPDPLAIDPEGEDEHYLRHAEAEKLASQASLHEKERDLVYASVFVLGWAERLDGKPEAVCAPLFYFPVTLSVAEMAHGGAMRFDPNRRQINFAVLDALGLGEVAEALEIWLGSGAVTESGALEARRRLLQAVPEADASAFDLYPELLGEGELRSRYDAVRKNHQAGIVLLPAAGLALIKKSPEMRGVLNELETMAQCAAALSPPVRALLGGSVPSVMSGLEGRVPAVLSKSQAALLDSAARHALTLMIGPPGTGKSFTIAALAIETLSRGGSVLIASKTDHAVDVVGDKIESAIGLRGVVTRGGRRQYLRDLRQFIEDLLNGVHTHEVPPAPALDRQRKALRRLDRETEVLREALGQRLDREIGWGSLLSDPAPSLFRRWRRKRLLKRLRKTPPAWELAERLEELTDEGIRLTVDFIAGARRLILAGELQKNRQRFLDLSRALRSRTGTAQAEFFRKAGLGRVLKALPVWLVNTSDVHRVLPMGECPFDLAIIDEATQCDMASALPILQRARRAVIAGDPKQLRHLSFLSHARQRAIAGQFELDELQRSLFNFRDVSLLDLASEQIQRQEQVAFLNEHFRSEPVIIDFSNRRFYSSQLTIMTGHRPHPPDSPPALSEVSVAGRREKRGHNPDEARAILAAIAELTGAESELPSGIAHSIGILSPFRDQVDHLIRQVSDSPHAARLIDRHQLLVGTAHTFQGEERDIVFLSLVLDDDSPASAFRFLERPDVFNVSITRARHRMVVYRSFDPARLPARSLVAEYLGHVAAATEAGTGSAPFRSPPASLPSTNTTASRAKWRSS